MSESEDTKARNEWAHKDYKAKMKEMWGNKKLVEDIGKVEKDSKELYDAALVLPPLLKKLNGLAKEKNARDFLEELKIRGLFGPSIRSCLKEITKSNENFQSEEFYVREWFKALNALVDRENTKSTEDHEYRSWVNTNYKKFLSGDFSEENVKKIQVYVHDLIRNLSLGGDFSRALRNKEWSNINLDKQIKEVDALIILLRAAHNNVKSMLDEYKRMAKKRL